MPRKTGPVEHDGDAGGDASMRPRPDAAENREDWSGVCHIVWRLQ